MVRLRLAWGNNAGARQRWTGQVTVEGGTFADLQPLGIESDAPVALRLEGQRLVVAPMQKRGFDGCDVTVRADEDAMVRFELRAEQTPQPTIVEAPLSQLANEQFRKPLDPLGGFLIAHRSPGDKLRVVLARDHLVFHPKETWNLRLQPDLDDELADGPVRLELRLHRLGGAKVLWQTSRQLVSESVGTDGLDFEIVCPDREDAYRLTITARSEEGFAVRFVPGQQAKLLASREVDFVVVDPVARLPRLADHWQAVLSVDPANPSWWQRLPSWAQVSRFSGKPSGSVGNIRPVARPGVGGTLVELPSNSAGDEPYWQSYTLPVREVGVPHVVEIDYPLGQEQHLAISVIEPDAAGRVMASGLDSGFYTKGLSTASDGALGTHRLVFWPRTRSPQLLIVNRHPTAPAQYGKIKLLRHDDQAAAAVESRLPAHRGRMVASYISKPRFTDSLGAPELLDVGSGLSVQSWSTFLAGANRLAQYLRLSGHNTVVLSVAADGSGLYPSGSLSPSPRYDTGLLATNGQDPLRKDVVEMLLRVFDREGLRVVPMLELTAPLPRLEPLRLAGNDGRTGIASVGATGKTWLEEYSITDGRAPYYNPLNDRVQREIAKLVSELADRYSSHPSFAGVGIKLSGDGYGVLPGVAWGLDDATVAAFSRETGLKLAEDGPDRFQRRAERLLGDQRQHWQAWRTEKLKQLYGKIAEALVAKRGDLQLLLATEDLFAGEMLQHRVRKAISEPTDLNQALLDCGLDLAGLNEIPGVVALASYRLGATDRLQQRAIDLRINSASDQGELLLVEKRPALQFYHLSNRLRLPSFDQRSPFGAKRTRLTLSSQPLPAGEVQRRHLVSALARGDAQLIVEGGEFLPMSSHTPMRRVLETLQELPGPEVAVRTQGVQPIVQRVYRSNAETTVLLINESPWPVTTELLLSSNEGCTWQKLGSIDGKASGSPSDHTGVLAKGEQDWQIALQPYDLLAWRFGSPSLRVGKPKVTLDSVVRRELQQRIQEIKSRTGNLDIERPYLQLQNPSFELVEEGVRIVGWQPRLGSAGQVRLETGDAHSGRRALRLQSQDKVGVAIQSNLFPVPETGQLTVIAYVRGVDVSPESRLFIAIQDSKHGHTYRQYTVLDKWAKYEFPVDDIPLGTNGQMRVLFHLTGTAEVLIDDVELYDLRFDKARRGALVKSVYAAKTALDEGQVIDCLRLVDEYWPQYLVEFVPTVEAETLREAKQPLPPEAAATEDDSQGIRKRLRGWVPRIWR